MAFVQPTLGIVGAGKAGSTLARLWSNANYQVVAVNSRTPAHMHALAEKVRAKVVATPAEVVANADLTLLTVPDDAIFAVAQGIATASINLNGKGIIHTSGAHGVEVLLSLAVKEAMTGSLHPAFPFADVETAIKLLPGATFAIEAEVDPLRTWLNEMIMTLHGQVIKIVPGQKTLYHAALCIASNYIVTLYAVAERLLLSLGAEHGTATHALDTLVGATVRNLQIQGIPAALTGPLVREDIGTVQSHLVALETVDTETADLYLQLARMTLPLLQKRGVDIEKIQEILGTKNDNPINYS